MKPYDDKKKVYNFGLTAEDIAKREAEKAERSKKIKAGTTTETFVISPIKMRPKK